MFTWVLLGSNAFARTLREIPLDITSESLPARLGAWTRAQQSDAVLPRELSVWSGADVEVRRRYRRQDGEAVDVFIAYFAAQDQRGELVNHRAGELHARALRLSVASPRVGVFEANLLPASAGAPDILFWYELDSSPSASRYVVKAKTLLSAMLQGRSNGAVIALVSRPRDQRVSRHVLQELAGLIEEAVAMRLTGRPGNGKS